MPEADTISAALRRLYEKGYVEDFKAKDDGLCISSANILVDPEDVIVDAIYRFEGDTNLEDEALIFALRYPKENYKGTYVVAFGPMMDPLDSKIVENLHRKGKSS